MSQSKWLDAISDRIGVWTLPTCISAIDVRNDKYWTLVIAEIPSDFHSIPKLRVYKGSLLISEQPLPGIPSALECFYMETSGMKLPIVAVSISHNIYFYRNMKPYFKYTIPELTVESLEMEMWKRLVIERRENYGKLIDNLKTIAIKETTRLTQQLIARKSIDDQEKLIRDHGDDRLQRLTYVTAMKSIQISNQDSNVVGCSHLIVATAASELIFLDCHSFSILLKIGISPLKPIPTMLAVIGQFNIDFRVIISGRDSSISLYRKNWSEGRQIVKLDEPAIGIALLPIDQSIICVCRQSSLECFSRKGKRLWFVTFESLALCMVPIPLHHLGVTLLCVSFENGSVKFYAQRKLVDEFSIKNERIFALNFGRLGEEDHCLSMLTKSGQLIIKILKRTGEFQLTDSPINFATTILNEKNPSNLLIPVKNKVFVSQMTRERENSSDMYRHFQSELWRLKLVAAKSTLRVIETADGNLSGDVGQAPIKLSAEILGLGTVYRILLTIENISAHKEAFNLFALLHTDHRLFRLERAYQKLPLMVPGAPIKISFKITVNMDFTDCQPPTVDYILENSYVRVMICKHSQAKPLIAAKVMMPLPENLNEEDDLV